MECAQTIVSQRGEKQVAQSKARERRRWNSRTRISAKTDDGQPRLGNRSCAKWNQQHPHGTSNPVSRIPSSNFTDQSAATGRPGIPPDATAARLHPMIRLHRSFAVCRRTGDRRPSRRRLSYRARDATASIFRRAPSRGGFRSRPRIAGMAWFGARARTFVDSGNAIADRRLERQTIMGTEGLGPRRSCHHGGACLRRAMFSPRNASPESVSPPPCSLPAWSDVQATLPPPPICTSSAANRPSAAKTSPHPDKPRWWRGAGEGHSVWSRTWLHGGKHRGGLRGRADRPDEQFMRAEKILK